MRLHKGQQAVVDHAARFNVVWVGRRWGKGVLAEHLADGPDTMILVPRRMLYRDEGEEVFPAVAESLTGRSLRRVVVDEAPHVSNLAGLFRKAIFPSVIEQSGEVWFLGTALDSSPYADDASDFLKLYRHGLDGEPGWMSYKGSSLENPMFPADELAGMKHTVGTRRMQQEFLVGS